MTTVAWDGVTLSGDGRITQGSEILTELYCKVINVNDKILIGGAGELKDLCNFIKWAKSEFSTDNCDVMESDFEDTFGAIIIYSDGKAKIFESCEFLDMPNEPMAVGSGLQFARASMYLGKSSKEAVEIASKFDSGTNNYITSVSFLGEQV